MKRQDGSRLAALVLAIVACGVLPAAAQGQSDATQKLIQRIAKSAKGHADAAASLLAAAKSLQDDPKVQVAFCEAAYEYGIKAAGGLGSALEALDILDKVAKDRAATWAEKRVVVYRIRYIRATGEDKQQHGQLLVAMLVKAGDEKSKQRSGKEAVGLYREALAVAKRLKLPEREGISQKLIAAVHLLQVQSTMDSLKAKLAANPGDKARRVSLIHMCLTALDSPAEAAKYLSDDCDESLRKYVPLAAKPLKELKETECLALAQWYEQLIGKGTTPSSKANAAGRAVRCYLQFLSLHKAKDAIGVGGRLALKSLEERIKKLGLKLPGGFGTFPAGIILALSFENGQWTKAADGAVVVKDISGRAGAALTGRISRGTPGAGGKVGTGIAFPAGSRAHLDIPAKATAGLKTFTFAFWVKTTESGAGRSYWAHPTFLGLATGAAGSRDYGITSSRGHIGYWSGLAPGRDSNHQSSSIRINDGQWHHVALTNDGKTLLLYVDARIVSPKGLPTGQSLTTMPVPLGASRGDSHGQPTGSHHSGTYDELQIYNRALTAAEIVAISRFERPVTTQPSTTKPATTKPSTAKPATIKPTLKARQARCPKCGKIFKNAFMLRSSHYRKSPSCRPR